MKLDALVTVQLRDFFESDEAYREVCDLNEVQAKFTWGDCDYSLVSIDKLVDVLVGVERPRYSWAAWQGVQELREMYAGLDSPIYIAL